MDEDVVETFVATVLQRFAPAMRNYSMLCGKRLDCGWTSIATGAASDRRTPCGRARESVPLDVSASFIVPTGSTRTSAR